MCMGGEAPAGLLLQQAGDEVFGRDGDVRPPRAFEEQRILSDHAPALLR